MLTEQAQLAFAKIFRECTSPFSSFPMQPLLIYLPIRQTSLCANKEKEHSLLSAVRILDTIFLNAAPIFKASFSLAWMSLHLISPLVETRKSDVLKQLS